jgi:hypothetical protein
VKKARGWNWAVQARLTAPSACLCAMRILRRISGAKPSQDLPVTDETLGSAVRKYVLAQRASLRRPISTAEPPLRGVRAVLSLPPSPPIANERRPGRLAGQFRYGIPEAIRRGFQGSKWSGSSNCNGHFQIETGWFDNTERRLA